MTVTSRKYHEISGKMSHKDMILDFTSTGSSSNSTPPPFKINYHPYPQFTFDLLVMGISAVFDWRDKEDIAGYWKITFQREREKVNLREWGIRAGGESQREKHSGSFFHSWDSWLTYALSLPDTETDGVKGQMIFFFF